MKTSRASLFLLLAAFFALSCSGPGSRHALEEYAVLPAGEVHEGWYFAAGRQVAIHGTVNGDVYVAGGTVEIDGTVNGMLVAAGGNVNVSGTVADRVLAAGGTIHLSGKTGKSITVAGGTVVVAKEGVIGENLLVAAGNVQMNGTVEHEAKAAGGEVELSGAIKGSLDVAASRFRTFQGSHIGGNLSVETNDSTRVNIDPGTVQGTIHITVERRQPEAMILGSTLAAFWFRIIFGLTLFLTALVLSFLTPRYLAAAGTEPISEPGQCILWGLIVLIVTPVVAFVLCITVIGLPLGLFLFLLYLWFLYLSQLALGAILGSRLYGLTGKKGWALFGPVAVGLIIIQILLLFPIVRPIVVIIGLIVGLGALALAVGTEYRSRRA